MTSDKKCDILYLEGMAEMITKLTAGSTSCAGYHQPKEPKALKNLKK